MFGEEFVIPGPTEGRNPEIPNPCVSDTVTGIMDSGPPLTRRLQ